MVIKVCHVTSADQWAGAEVHLVNLLSAMSKIPTLEVSAVLFTEGRLARELRELGIAVTVIPEQTVSSLTILKRLVQHFLDHKYSIIHTHKPKDGFLGAIASKVSGTSYVVRTFHGSWEPFSGVHYVKMKVYQFIDWIINRYLVSRLIAVASDLYSSRLSSYGPESLICIENGIDFDKVKIARDNGTVRKDLGIAESDIIIGTVGRLNSVKGQGYLLKAAKALIERGRRIKILLVGGGPLEAQLKALAVELRIENDVLFVGHQDAPCDFINAMDIFALPSLQEGLPMVLLEALTLSRPVVATRVGGIPEVIEDGVNGLLVESGNIEELADALAVLMRDLTAAERLGEKGRMRVQENFTAQIMAERTADVYRQIVASESLGLTTIAPQEPV